MPYSEQGTSSALKWVEVKEGLTYLAEGRECSH